MVTNDVPIHFVPFFPHFVSSLYFFSFTHHLFVQWTSLYSFVSPYSFVSFFTAYFIFDWHVFSPWNIPSVQLSPQGSIVSYLLWLMLVQHHPSQQCHRFTFKIQSFGAFAVILHRSCPPFWLWLRGTIGMVPWCQAEILNTLDIWSIWTLMCFDRFL